MVKLRFDLVRDGEQFHAMDPSASWAKWTKIPDVTFIIGKKHRFNAALVHARGGQPHADLRYFQPSQTVRVHRD